MERKRNSGFRRIFTVAFDRLLLVNRPCRARTPSGAKNRRKATVKIRRNPLLQFISLFIYEFKETPRITNKQNSLIIDNEGHV